MVPFLVLGRAMQQGVFDCWTTWTGIWQMLLDLQWHAGVTCAVRNEQQASSMPRPAHMSPLTYRPTDGSRRAGLKTSARVTASSEGSNSHLHCLQEDVISMVADAGSGTTWWGPAHARHRLAASNLRGETVGASQLTSGNMSAGGRLTQWLQNGEHCCSNTGTLQSTWWSVQANGELQCTER